MRRCARTRARTDRVVCAPRVAGRPTGWRRRACSGGDCRALADVDGVTDRDPTRDGDLAQDAEIDLGPGVVRPKAAVAQDRPERVEVALAGVRVLRRDRAARVGLRDQNPGRPDRDVTADPAVLLV